MDILVLGGNGAMGVPVVNKLNDLGHTLYVTSRSSRESVPNIKYIQGNAHDDNFFRTLLTRKYDAIIDFMVYNSSELNSRLDEILKNTNQYVFFSSSRVYAQSKTEITEESPRLLEVCKDPIYMQTDEYALAKAREENLLFNSKNKNWTIIRPYITYNSQRLQLGVYEKENWLYRALHGRTIVFPRDIAAKKTTLTFGPDVAEAVVTLIGNEKARGEVFHIVNPQVITWEEILTLYLDIIQKKTGKRPRVKYTNDSSGLQQVWNPWQIKYDRLYDRRFNSSKIESICGKYQYKTYQQGLEECLTKCLENPIWLGINWRFEAWADKISGERTPLREVGGNKIKLKYLKWRYF